MNRIQLAAISLSAAALVGIVTLEGYTPSVTIPVPGDKPTIGYGTTEGVKPGDTTTPVKALERALIDINKFEGALKDCVKVPMYQNEYDAFISFSYNVGSRNFCGSTMVKKLNNLDYMGACREILRWTYFQGKDCKNPANRCSGLVKRRQSEYQLCIGLK